MKANKSAGRSITPSKATYRGQQSFRGAELLESRRLLAGNLTQFHYDPSSTGQDLTETVLSPANVNSADFGRQFITQLDGQVYAQPLAVESINITRVGSNSSESTGVHNVLYVATMHDSLFAVDSDTGAILWQDSFLQINSPQVTANLSPSPTAGVIPFPQGITSSTENAGINANDVAPEEGVFGTPVIDLTKGVLYCISYAQERRTDTSSSAIPSATGTDWHFVERLWAINLADGSVAVTPTVPAGAPVPASMGQTIADTAINYTGSTFPSFSSFNNYEYFAGPSIKGSGVNGDSALSHNADTDGWVTNPNDLPGNSSHSAFAGSTPYAQGDLALNALLQPTRTGMTLLNGVIYFGMTSHGDEGPYYGWVLGYNASTLRNTTAFVTTPTWENYNVISGSAGASSSTYDAEGAIWGGSQSIVTDGTYLYMSVGNGAFNWTSVNFPANGTNTTTDNGNRVQLPLDGDYGNAIIKLAVDPNANQGGLSITSLPATFNPDGTNPGQNGQNVNGYGLKVTDFFVASNMIYLNYKDQDVGSCGVTLLPASLTSTVPGHVGDPMLVAGGKEGRVYLIDRNNMGGFDTSYFSNNAGDTTATYANGTVVFSSPGNGVPNAGPDPISYDRLLGEYENLGSAFTIPSFYMNGTVPTLVIDGSSAGVRAFNLNTFQYTTASLPASANNPAPLGTSSVAFPNHGSTSSISANGSSNAIVWNIYANKSTSGDALDAFTLNLSSLYTSPANSLTGGVTNATAMKFSVPSIFNGMAYVGTGAGWGSSGSTQTAWAQGAIVGYGLLNSYLTSVPTYFGAPSNLSGSDTSTGVSLSWTRNSTLETESQIDRSSNNGSTWSTIAFVPNGANSFTDTTAVLNQSYQYRVRAISAANVTPFATSSSIVYVPTTYTGTSATDGYYLRLAPVGSTEQIWVGPAGSVGPAFNATPTYSTPLSDLPNLSFTPGAGNDALTVDLSNGSPVPSGGISFSGGIGINSIAIAGSAGNDTVSVNAAQIIANGSAPINYLNTESIQVSLGTGTDTLTQSVQPGNGATLSFVNPTLADTLNVNSGSYTIPAPAMGAGPVPFSIGTLSVGSSANVVLATAGIHSDRTVLILNSLNIPQAAGSLNLGGNDVIIHNTVGTVAAVLATINVDLQTGFNGGTWTGAGIDSTVAAIDTTHLTAIGMMPNGSATPFDGQPVTATDILLKFTYYGDADLSGVADGSDYTRIDNGYLSPATGWFNGDFNYDSVIDGSDYTLIDNAFNTQGQSLAQVFAHAQKAFEQSRLPATASSVTSPADNLHQAGNQQPSSAVSNLDSEILALSFAFHTPSPSVFASETIRSVSPASQQESYRFTPVRSKNVYRPASILKPVLILINS